MNEIPQTSSEPSGSGPGPRGPQCEDQELTNESAELVLSVVVSPVTDGSSLPGCLDALRTQTNPPPMNVIVPFDDSIAGLDSLRKNYPEVQFLSVAGTADLALAGDLGLAHEAIDRRRACALRAATGSIVALTDAQARPAPDWCARIVKAHKNNYAVIGGAIENGRDRQINWAIYFCDFGRYQNPLQEGPARYVSDVNVSYKRRVLEDVADVWRQIYNEVAVHAAIRDQGETLWLRRDLIVYLDRGMLSFARTLRERLAWARVYAGRRCTRLSVPRRLLHALTSPLLGGLLLLRQARLAFSRGRHKKAFLKALPLLILVDLIWSVGEFVGYVTARATPRR